VGSSFIMGSLLEDGCILAMQTGKFPKPFKREVE